MHFESYNKLEYANYLNRLSMSSFHSFHLFIYGEGSPLTQMSVFKGPSHKIKLKLTYKINIKTIKNITKNLFTI